MEMDLIRGHRKLSDEEVREVEDFEDDEDPSTCQEIGPRGCCCTRKPGHDGLHIAVGIDDGNRQTVCEAFRDDEAQERGQ